MKRLVPLLGALFVVFLAVETLAAFDPETGAITDERWRTGVPLGGIGCGAVELLTDGALGNATINHNWDRPTGTLRGAFAAVQCKTQSGSVSRMLRLPSDAEYEGVASIAHTRYVGMFPRAELSFTEDGLPIDVSLHAWSPLIPRNVKDSALPVAFFEFVLHNPGDQAVDATVAMSWENILGFGGRSEVDWNPGEGRYQATCSSGGWKGVRFATSQTFDDMRQNTVGEQFLGVLSGDGVTVSTCPTWDAGSPSISWWREFSASGAFPGSPGKAGEKPAGAVSATVGLAPGASQRVTFVLAWHMPTFRMEHTVSSETGELGEPADAGRGAFDGDLATRWGTGRGQRPGDELTIDLGREALVDTLLLDSTPSPQDYPRGYRVEAKSEGGEWTQIASATLNEVQAAQSGGLLRIGFEPVAARSIRLASLGNDGHWWWSIHELTVSGPQGEVDIPGAKASARLMGMVTRTNREDVGHFFLNDLPDIRSLLAYASAHRERLLDETREWQEQVMASNLPFWLKLKLVNCTFSMYSATVLTKDGRFAVLESPVHMGGALGTMDQRMAAHAFYTQMFPSLDQSELDLFLQCQQEDGRITHFNGNFHEVIGDPRVGYGITDWPDLSSSWIMQVLKLYRWTGDRAFLDEMWPGIQQAIAWLESADTDGDLIPEGGSTYDYEQLPRGAFIYSANCYLGALLAAEEVAKVQGDPQAAEQYRERFVAVRKAVMHRLWNGEFFGKWRSATTDAENPNSFVAALAGDWLAHLCGLGDTLAQPVIDGELTQLIARHVKPFFPVPPMEVTPEGKLATSTCFFLQHEPYLGCEAIYRGFVEDGLEVLRGVYFCAWEKNKSPWDQSLVYSSPSGNQGGLRSYMTCPTSWHVLNALTGVTLDVPGKTLYVSPRTIPGTGELHCPVFLGTFWAWVDYIPAKRVLSFKVLKTFSDCDVEITRVGREGSGPFVKLNEPLGIEEGAQLDLSPNLQALAPYPHSRTVDWQVKPEPAVRPGINPEGWTVAANVPGAPASGGEPAAQAIDGDTATRWTTGRGMRPGDWFQVDLGKEQSISGVWADISGSKKDYPRGYDVMVSLDGEQWVPVASADEATSRRSVHHEIWRCEFAPVKARYVRIVQNGSHDYWWYSICELYVLPEGFERPVPVGQPLKSRMRKAK